MRSTGGFMKMVLQGSTLPAWLSSDSPSVDVILSSRARFARSLRGHRFPHRCDRRELLEVQAKVLKAFKNTDLEVIKSLSPVERDFWLGCRIISPEFEWDAPGRVLLLSPDRGLSIMVNEEDHVRIQALSAGWSIKGALAAAEAACEHLESRVEVAHTPERRYLTTSPYNAGTGRRLSAMFHLIALAHQKRLPPLIRALAARGLTARGLFGESSRAIGAFVQVSAVEGRQADFVGAADYLLAQEREARKEVGRAALQERCELTKGAVIAARRLDLADSLRILGWLRWAAVAGLKDMPNPRQVDLWLSTIELGAHGEASRAAEDRADFLRSCLNPS